MPLDANEIALIKTAIETNKPLAEIEILKPVLDLGVNIRTKTGEEEFLKNFENTVIGKKTSEIYSALDKDISDVLGVPKNDGEKTYDYLKRAGLETKKNLGTLTEELEKLKQSKDASEHFKKQIEKMQSEFTTKEKTLSEENKTLKHQLEGKETEFVVRNAIAGLQGSFKKDIPEAVLKTFVANVTGSLIKSAKTVNGELVFVDEKGDVLLDTTTYKPKTAEMVAREILKDVIDAGKQQGGAGTGGDGGKGGKTGGDPKAPFVFNPDKIKNRMQLHEALKEHGLDPSTKEFAAEWEKYATPQLPIR